VSARKPSETLQIRPDGPLPSLDLQELWFAALSHAWSSLVVVPADRGISSSWIGEALGQMARFHSGGELIHLKAEGLDLHASAELLTLMAARNEPRGPGEQQHPWLERHAVVVIDPVVTNPTGVAVALAVDAALLHVRLGRTNVRSARRTIELIGRERFIGCVIES
jgi:hypothetical protein